MRGGSEGGGRGRKGEWEEGRVGGGRGRKRYV